LDGWRLEARMGGAERERRRWEVLGVRDRSRGRGARREIGCS